MTVTLFTNILVIAASIASCVDLIAQIRHLTLRKSSDDVSLMGTFIRFLAANALFTKFIIVGDSYLIGGQLLFNLLLALYLYKVMHYRHRKHGKWYTRDMIKRRKR